jgi:hypothetical protein
MRLLHATTLEFEVFHDNQTPQYLILSHTWGNEEVTYQDMRFLQQCHALPYSLNNNSILMPALEAAAGLKISAMDRIPVQARIGYEKILKTAKLAKEHELDYFWIDTCCIDKSSSAELQEAINSMYRWYQQSCLCAVYLEDAFPARDQYSGVLFEFNMATMLRGSKWITRGWTLQELIAPETLEFYDRKWGLMGSRNDFYAAVAEATGIPPTVLYTGDLSRVSVAQKMSWAANRETTRVEDRAYSLMGLFGIHMPMLYGEGDNAFRRLQEEIIRTTPDESIFAWRAVEGSISSCSGLLAKSPNDFEGSQFIQFMRDDRTQFATSNLGLRLETWIYPLLDGGCDEVWDDSIFALSLCVMENRSTVALLVRRLSSTHYTRVSPDTFKTSKHLSASRSSLETVYVEHTPRIPSSFRSRAMYYFQFQFDSTVYRIQSAQPEQLWDPIHNHLSISSEYLTDNSLKKKEYSGAPMFYGTVRLFHRGTLSLACSINVGHNFLTGQAWLRLLNSDSTPADAHWRSVCQESEGCHMEMPPAPPFRLLRISESEVVRVTMLPGLHRGMISYIVQISQEQSP